MVHVTCSKRSRPAWKLSFYGGSHLPDLLCISIWCLEHHFGSLSSFRHVIHLEIQAQVDQETWSTMICPAKHMNVIVI